MTKPLIVAAREKDSFDFGGLSVRLKVEGNQTAGRFSVVRHLISPHALGAPLHYHHNEDEWSYVLTGRLGAFLATTSSRLNRGCGSSSRGISGTRSGTRARHREIIEVISPAGVENYFREVADAWGDLTQCAHINQKYALEMRLERWIGLTFPAL